MIHKKSAILLSSYNGLAARYQCPPQSSASFTGRPTSSESQRKDGYATIAHDDSHLLDEDLRWPALKNPSTVPTPYQILRLERSAPYTKHHFHRLVKLYHPDVSSHEQVHASICHLPEHVRLERYRLIIAAHTILSDPHKRQLYDRFGSGWEGRPDVPGFGFTREPPKWRPGQDPMRNATWEDWERWYQRDEEPQSTRMMSNGTFVSLIVMFAALGGIGQATRAKGMSVNFMEQRDALNDRTHQDLMKVKEDARASSRQKRVDVFLQKRDPAIYADEGLRKMMLEPDICESAHVEEGKGAYNKANRRR
ncbi:hypothetical protein NA57DRAFT_58436 [Rhizodiscina lignyota]|uniref:J domain-containing protein n=1 Tax=Rhizodiscina lignyota TaxID=1504668 RepID=A0A9P4IDG2_9PEZI|nr:hypothetical protein NA57DRAFT_58436 [Rhizodiscina lignyota]